MTDGLARFLVSEHLNNVQNTDKVINLKGQVSAFENEVGLMNEKVEFLEGIIQAQSKIDTVQAERMEMTAEQIKRMKRQKVEDWFRTHYKMFILGVGGFGLGFGVGYLGR